ncbi:hypothetical protein OH799_18525 [Nocardia sp. NBC_00881]|uniref:hypothetical protein n=1 Tax=Nocardia sp. NBC_00881 TaxID=2975995 RepID=UPI0038679A66|nr:hypothetical protein OH799_18525 [Nocardia sp. NBC_00881]
MTRMEMPVKQMTVSMSEAKEPVERSLGSYTLHNDTDSHASIYISDGRQGYPKHLITLAPGATSDSFDDGSWAALLWIESGYHQQIQWHPDSFMFTGYYQAALTLRPNQNNVSSFA